MEEYDLESTVESKISAIYSFESIRGWDRAVLGVEEVLNLLVWGKVWFGNDTRLRGYSRPQDCHSEVLLCAFADEGAKESSIWYSRAVRAVCVCVCAAQTQMIYHSM